MDSLRKIDTVVFLFLLLAVTSAAAYYKIPLNDMVFGAILLALNVKNGNGASNGTNTPAGTPVVAGSDTPKA
jgi:hypothetical protein